MAVIKNLFEIKGSNSIFMKINNEIKKISNINKINNINNINILFSDKIKILLIITDANKNK